MLRPTDILRVPLTQEANIILEPCSVALLREVQMLIPNSDPMVLAAECVLPNEIGPNRTYKLAPMPPGTTIKFTLGPEQWLVAAVDVAHQAITLVVAYLPLPAGYAPTRMQPPPRELPSKDNPTREIAPVRPESV